MGIQDFIPSPCLQLPLSSRLGVCSTKKKQQGYFVQAYDLKKRGGKGDASEEGKKKNTTAEENPQKTPAADDQSCKGSQAISCLGQIKREVSLLLSHKAHFTPSERHFAAPGNKGNTGLITPWLELQEQGKKSRDSPGKGRWGCSGGTP